MHGEKCDVITLFHVLEHLHDPRETLVSLKSHLQPQEKILIEVPNTDESLLKLYKNKGFVEFYWSCHLYVFTVKTLEKAPKRRPTRSYWVRFLSPADSKKYKNRD